MHNKIVEVLESLGIDIGFMEYEGNANEYIIFDIYNELDSNFSDDENLSNTYYIQVNYWFKSFNLTKLKNVLICLFYNKKNWYTKLVNKFS